MTTEEKVVRLWLALLEAVRENRPMQSGNAVVVRDTSLVDPQGANAP